MIAQTIANGLLVGALYACLAVGFSLVWGVLNIINMMHGSLVVAGAYIVIFGVQALGMSPLAAALLAAVALFALGAALQYGFINRVVDQPILVTLTLTFGLDLIIDNALLQGATATPRSLVLHYGSVTLGGIVLPVVRLAAMVLAVVMTAGLYALLRHSRIGRAIIAVRMDRLAAAILGLRINRIYAITFGIGALMAGAAGAAIAVVYPVTPMMSGQFLGRSFVICVLGGLGSVPGAMVGGLVLGLIESFGNVAIGSQWSSTLGFALMLLVLVLRPAGIAGRRGFE